MAIQYTPFIAQGVQAGISNYERGQEKQRQGQIRKIFGSAYMGDESSRQQLGQLDPNLLIKLDQMKTKQAQLELDRGTKLKKAQIDTYHKNKGAVDKDIERAAKLGSPEAFANHFKTLADNAPSEELRQMYLGFDEEDYEHAQEMFPAPGAMTEYQKAQLAKDEGGPFDFGSSREGIAYKNYALQLKSENPGKSDEEIRNLVSQHMLEKDKYIQTPQGTYQVPGQKLPTFGDVSELAIGRVAKATESEAKDQAADETGAKPLFEKPVPEAAKKRMAGHMAMYDSIKPLIDLFKDDYVGSFTEMGQSAENEWAKRFGDESQVAESDWWQRYEQMVVDVRNDKFGATLTDNEKKSFEKLIVLPTFSAAAAKSNMERQMAIVSAALRREKKSLISEKFNKGSIEALTEGFEDKKEAKAAGEISYEFDDSKRVITKNGKQSFIPDQETYDRLKNQVQGSR